MLQKEMSQLSRWFDTIPESVQAEFVQEKLGALLQSSAYSQELLWTLQVYLESNGHARAASKRLYIHRNTLSYRLSRLQTILGCDLKDLDTIIDLRLALAFYRKNPLIHGGEEDVQIEKIAPIS